MSFLNWFRPKESLALPASAENPRYDLYYPVDQEMPGGDKVWVESFFFLDACHDQAIKDGQAHYSVEEDTGQGFSIVFKA
jgi:hypothetical protein